MNHTVDLKPDITASLLKADESAVRGAIAEIGCVFAQSAPATSRQRGIILAVGLSKRLRKHKSVTTNSPAIHSLGPSSVESATEDMPSGSVALNIIGYLSSLALSEDEALGIARIVFDPLHEAVCRRTFSKNEERYLSKNITPYTRSWPLRKALVQSALTKWPVTPIQAGAFSVTRRESIQDEIIDEIFSRRGKAELEVMLGSSYLSERASSKNQQILSPPRPRLVILGAGCLMVGFRRCAVNANSAVLSRCPKFVWNALPHQTVIPGSRPILVRRLLSDALRLFEAHFAHGSWLMVPRDKQDRSL